MKESLLGILACPACKGDLTLTTEKSGDEVLEGLLTCNRCGCNYPIHRGVPRFVAGDKYVPNFSMEWTLHRQTQMDSVSRTRESENTFREKTGFPPGSLKDKLVLDVGCGSGRFMEIAANDGAEVVGIDLSFAVDSAYKNLGLRRNVSVIQADIFSLPFKDACFDRIFSIGVLHHTPSTRQAFRQLLRLLKDGAEVAIWVYSNEGAYTRLVHTVSDFYRIFTTRMPARWLYALSRVSVPLYYPKKIMLLALPLNVVLPTSVHPIPEWRVLDTFDWYSPKYQWKHTRKEVARWFEEEGLKDIVVADVPVAVRGRR